MPDAVVSLPFGACFGGKLRVNVGSKGREHFLIIIIYFFGAADLSESFLFTRGTCFGYPARHDSEAREDDLCRVVSYTTSGMLRSFFQSYTE